MHEEYDKNIITAAERFLVDKKKKDLSKNNSCTLAYPALVLSFLNYLKSWAVYLKKGHT